MDITEPDRPTNYSLNNDNKQSAFTGNFTTGGN